MSVLDDEEARRNSEKQAVTNVELSNLTMSYQSEGTRFVHSHSDAAHPSQTRRTPVATFDRSDESGGVAALHLLIHGTGGCKQPRAGKVSRWLRERCAAHNLVNLAKGRRFDHPFMLMNSYDLNKLFSILQAQGSRHAHLSFTSHNGHWGVMILFQKS